MSNNHQLAMNFVPIIDLVDSLAEILQGDDIMSEMEIQLPSIIMVGDQSSGKSSILEKLSTIHLPKGFGMVTTCPLRIQLRQRRDLSVSISYLNGQVSKNIRLEDCNGEIVKAQQAIQQKNSSSHRVTNRMVSDDVIRLDIHSPKVPNLTLIDLPGLVRTKSDDQHTDIVSMTERLARQYISSGPAILLCCIEADRELTNSPLDFIFKSKGDNDVWTVGVFNKADKIDNAFKPIAVECIRGNRAAFSHGSVLISATKETIDQDFENDAEFCKLPAHQKGFDSLIQLLSVTMSRLVKKNLPEKLSELKNKLKSVEESLNKLSLRLLTDAEKHRYCFEETKEFISKATKVIVEGDEIIIKPNGFDANKNGIFAVANMSRDFLQKMMPRKSRIHNEGNCWQTEEDRCTLHNHWRFDYFKALYTDLKEINQKLLLDNDAMFCQSELEKYIRRYTGEELEPFFNPKIIEIIIQKYFLVRYQKVVDEFLEKIRINLEWCFNELVIANKFEEHKLLPLWKASIRKMIDEHLKECVTHSSYLLKCMQIPYWHDYAPTPVQTTHQLKSNVATSASAVAAAPIEAANAAAYSSRLGRSHTNTNLAAAAPPHSSQQAAQSVQSGGQHTTGQSQASAPITNEQINTSRSKQVHSVLVLYVSRMIDQIADSLPKFVRITMHKDLVQNLDVEINVRLRTASSTINSDGAASDNRAGDRMGSGDGYGDEDGEDAMFDLSILDESVSDRKEREKLTRQSERLRRAIQVILQFQTTSECDDSESYDQHSSRRVDTAAPSQSSLISF